MRLGNFKISTIRDNCHQTNVTGIIRKLQEFIISKYSRKTGCSLSEFFLFKRNKLF